MNYGLISSGNIQLKERGRNARQEKMHGHHQIYAKKIIFSQYTSFFFFYSSFSYEVLILDLKFILFVFHSLGL